MFDWEDAELANIIWGEAGENEDHIVPYPDEVKCTEKNVSVTDTHERSSKYHDTIGKVSTDEFGSLPDLSSSSATNLDLEQTDVKCQVDTGSKTFDNQPDGRENRNFVDYGWANVGSFDDLDGILSNHDLVYGNVNTDTAEALWSSTKDVIGSEKTELLSMDSQNLSLGDSKSDIQCVEARSGFLKDEKPTNDSLGKVKEKSASDTVRRSPPHVYPIAAVNVALADNMIIGKMDGQRISLKSQKQTQTSYDPWTSLGTQGKELDGQHTQHIKISSSTARNQQIEPSSGYHEMENQHSLVPTLPLSMTPQEKIEKLRKRQQMRALLAIRKQQQEFKNQESQMVFGNAGNTEIDENLSSLISLDVSSPLEQSDSDSRPMMMMDNSTLEDKILHQLENVIAKLGTEIRLCIRDSLYRLAQNALQRQNDVRSVDSSSRSRDEPTVVVEERSSSTKRSARPPDGETKTNPIDRAVAHLLFHMSPELLRDASTARLPCEPSS